MYQDIRYIQYLADQETSADQQKNKIDDISPRVRGNVANVNFIQSLFNVHLPNIDYRNDLHHGQHQDNVECGKNAQCIYL